MQDFFIETRIRRSIADSDVNPSDPHYPCFYFVKWPSLSQ